MEVRMLRSSGHLWIIPVGPESNIKHPCKRGRQRIAGGVEREVSWGWGPGAPRLPAELLETDSQSLRREPSLAGLWTSGLHNWAGTHFCCSEPPGLGWICHGSHRKHTPYWGRHRGQRAVHKPRDAQGGFLWRGKILPLVPWSSATGMFYFPL